jgi:hypothetical protein
MILKAAVHSSSGGVGKRPLLRLDRRIELHAGKPLPSFYRCRSLQL